MLEVELTRTGWELKVGDKFWTKLMGCPQEYSPITRLVFGRGCVKVFTQNGWNKSVTLDGDYPIKRVIDCECCKRCPAAAPVDIDGINMNLCCGCGPVMRAAVEQFRNDLVEQCAPVGAINLDAL